MHTYVTRPCQLLQQCVSKCGSVVDCEECIHAGLQSWRPSHVAKAAETTGASGFDFGSLFSDAMSDSSAKTPPKQLPDLPATAPTENATVATSDSTLSLPKSFTRPPDAGPSLPQPIQQAAEQLTKSGDAASSNLAEPLGDSSAEPAGNAFDAGVSVTDSAASVVESAHNVADDVVTSVQGTVSDLFDSGSATASSAFAAADEASASLRAAADDSLAVAQNTANDLLSSALGAGDEATEGLAQLTSGLGANASQASSAAADAAGQAFGIPAPLQTERCY